MRVGFDLTSAVKPRPRGISNYIRGLVSVISSVETDLKPFFFIRDGKWFKRNLIANLVPEAPRKWLLADRTGVSLDLFHGLDVRLPVHKANPQIFTLHDLRVLDSQDWDTQRWIDIRTRKIRQTLERADGILFLAQHGLNRFRFHFPDFPKEKLGIAPLGVQHDVFRPWDSKESAPILLKHNITRPYLLHVSQLSRHKNPELSIQAFAESQASAAGMLLLFVGGVGQDYHQELLSFADKFGVKNQVQWIHQLPYEELPAFYSSAEAVLVPSLYEGFGLPLLEAMACGAAGVFAHTTCLPEVSGKAWPSAPADDVPAFARNIDRFLIDPHFCRETRAAAIQRASEFSWERCAKETLSFHQKILHCSTS